MIKVPVPFFNDGASESEVKPDFKLIKEFYNYPPQYESFFKPNFWRFKTIPEYSSLTNFLKCKNLDTDANLYFFAITYHRLYENMEENKNSDHLEEHKKYINDARKMKLQFQELKDSEVKDIESIVFHISNENKKKEHITIDNKELIADFYFQLHDWLVNLEVPTPFPKIKTKDSYFPSFIRYTFPLFNYMNATHHKANKTKTKTYEFIQVFLESIGVDFEKYIDKKIIPFQYIKDRYIEANINKPE